MHKVKGKGKERSNRVRKLVLDIKSRYHITSFGLPHKQQLIKQKNQASDKSMSQMNSLVSRKMGRVTTVFGGNPLLIEYNGITCIQR